MSLPYEILECTGGDGKEVMHISAVKFVPQGSLQSHLRTLSRALNRVHFYPPGSCKGLCLLYIQEDPFAKSWLFRRILHSEMSDYNRLQDVKVTYRN